MKKLLSSDDVIYFVMTDRFYGKDKRNVDPSDKSFHGGTLDGLLDKLDYLSELGVTTIWTTPVAENIPESGDTEPYHGYWIQDFEKIDSRLLDGTRLPTSTAMSTFGKFVDICEKKGFKVILDMVVNHAGYGAQGRFDTRWFNVNGSGDIKGELSGLPDFNHDNPEVVEYFISNIERWVTKGKVSNIRMDTAKHVERNFWHHFKSQIHGQYHVRLIGEVLLEGKDQIKDVLKYQNYHDFFSTFDFALCTALKSSLIYDQSVSDWIARPRVNDSEPLGVLDYDNPEKDGYRSPITMVTLVENHDLEKRIMSHARTKHTGDGAGLDWAIKVTKLCLGALFTMRGIPHLYYGTEIGMEGWKAADDRDLRRDFPWHVIGADHHPKPEFRKEKEIYEWTRSLIKLRKDSHALKFGTTITLWSDNFVYAFLRISTDDVVLAIINNGYQKMPQPIRLYLNPQKISQRVIKTIKGAMKHWQTGKPLKVENDHAVLTVEGKTIDIFCST